MRCMLSPASLLLLGACFSPGPLTVRPLLCHLDRPPWGGQVYGGLVNQSQPVCLIAVCSGWNRGPRSHWSPNLQHLRMWPFLEIGSLERSWRSHEVISVGPNLILLVSSLKGEIWTQRQLCIEGRWCVGAERTTSTSQGMPELLGARREAWHRFFLMALRRNLPCQCLDLGLLASGTMRQSISVI